MSRVLKIFCVLATSLVSCARAQSPSDKAFAYLNKTEDRGIERWYVYDDVDSGLAHLYPSKWLNGGASLNVDADCRDRPFSGTTCIRIDWKNTPGLNREAWNGIIWHNSETWDGLQGPAYNLSGATKIEGRIRSGTPGLQVSLFFGGDPVNVDKTYARLEGDDDLQAYMEPSTEHWQNFTIDLSSRRDELKSVQSGLGFTVSDVHTKSGSEAVFYLDEISYNLARPASTPRLIPSYGLHPDKSNLFTLDPVEFMKAEPTTRNVAYVYDQALVIDAFLARGDAEGVRRARIIADGLVYCAANHRSFDYAANPDCKVLTNGPMAGDAEQWSGRMPPAGKSLAARVSGWYDIGDPDPSKRWKEDMRQVSTNTGDMAWAIIALCALYNRTQDAKYLETAVGLGHWVRKYCRMKGDVNPGFTGGMEGWPDQRPASYKSVEMNLDLIVAFYSLAKAANGQSWALDMRSARDFVNSQFDAAAGHYRAGVSVDPANPGAEPKPNTIQNPLDVNTWALLVLGRNDETLRGFRWVEKNCSTVNEPHGLTGFAFSDADRTGVWVEGTGQMIVGYRMLGDEKNAARCLDSLRRMQAESPGGEGIVASSKDGLWTGFDAEYLNKNGQPAFTHWNYFTQIHLGGLAWFIFGELGYNPYYQISAQAPLPRLPL